VSLRNIEFKDQRALTLILDLLHLLEIAGTAHPESLRRAAARAAITNAALLLECVANSCLLSLALPSKLAEEMDRLPTLPKLDYFLFASEAMHIDRGCRESELAAEAMRLRDHIVHPKPRSGEVVAIDDEGQPDVHYGATKASAIPFDTRQWSVSIAIPLVQAVFAFIKKFFLEWCKLDRGRITTILICREKDFVQCDMDTCVSVPPDELALLKNRFPEVLDFLDLREPSEFDQQT